MMARWIDYDVYGFVGETHGVGHIGYLVRTLNTSTGRESYSLRDRPLRTNRSNETRIDGWCGETDNRSRYAEGVWKVIRLNAAGNRAQIVQLKGEELAAFLERDGYPELILAEEA